MSDYPRISTGYQYMLHCKWKLAGATHCLFIAALKFCFKTCIAMKFVDDDDDNAPQ